MPELRLWYRKLSRLNASERPTHILDCIKSCCWKRQIKALFCYAELNVPLASETFTACLPSPGTFLHYVCARTFAKEYDRFEKFQVKPRQVLEAMSHLFISRPHFTSHRVPKTGLTSTLGPVAGFARIEKYSPRVYRLPTHRAISCTGEELILPLREILWSVVGHW